MNLKFNFFFVAPTPSTIGNCARDIKLALIEARRTNKKIVLLRCYEIFKPLKIKVANKELFNLNSNFILKPNPFYLFQIQLLLTIIFSFAKIISYFKKIFFGRHLAYNYTTPCFGNFKILRGNKKNFHL